MHRRLLFAALAISLASPALARDSAPAANPQIDYAGFATLTARVRTLRANRLIDHARFKAMAASKEVLLLDARSADKFAQGHIAGAVNLPLTDFTAEALADAIGRDRNRPILIYCNNNFANHRMPVPLKSAPLALNIQTFINLVGYGYGNVWELADVVDFTDPKVDWVAGK